MEESQLIRFGDVSSADVELWLTGPNKESYERNPVHLHSLILERSEFFKAKMSERWSSDVAKEIRVTTDNFDDYITCIQFIYGDLTKFRSVRQCLGVLLVASELLLDDITKKCMRYLQQACCTAEQVTQIREAVSFLGLELLPEYAAKFSYIMHVERLIKQMLSLAKDKHAGTRNQVLAKNFITKIMKGGAWEDAVKIETCKQVLFQEFKSSVCSGDVVSSLGFNLVRDLAAKLHKEEDTDIILEEKAINLMLSVIKDKNVSIESRYSARIYIEEILDGNVSQDAVEVCQRVVLTEFKSSIHSRNISVARSLACFILCRCWDRDIHKAAFIAFLEDPKFIKYVNGWYIYLRFVGSAEDLHVIVNLFMEAIRRKQIILTDSQISCFLTTWPPIMAKLRWRGCTACELDKARLAVVSST